MVSPVAVTSWSGQLYLSSVPPTRGIRHKAYVRWVRAQGHSPHAPGMLQKYLGPCQHSPKGGRQAINLTSPKRVKARRDAPLASGEAHLTKPRSWQHGRPKCDPTTGEVHQTRGFGQVFVFRPTTGEVWHKAVFKVGPVAGPKPTPVRQCQKYLRPRWHSPY